MGSDDKENVENQIKTTDEKDEFAKKRKRDVKSDQTARNLVAIVKRAGGKISIDRLSEELSCEKQYVVDIITIIGALGIVEIIDGNVVVKQTKKIKKQNTEKEIIIETRNKQGKLVKITTTVKINIVGEDEDEEEEEEEEKIIDKNDQVVEDAYEAKAWSLIHQRAQIQRARKQIVALNHYTKYMEKQIDRLTNASSPHVDFLCLDSKLIHQCMQKDDEEKQLVLLRGPPGAELNVDCSKKNTKAFQMKLKSSSKTKPLQAYLMQPNEGLANIFQAPCSEPANIPAIPNQQQIINNKQ